MLLEDVIADFRTQVVLSSLDTLLCKKQKVPSSIVSFPVKDLVQGECSHKAVLNDQQIREILPRPEPILR